MNIVSLHQRTPLHMAAEGGHMDTVKFLVTKKTNINTKDVDQVSAGDIIYCLTSLIVLVKLHTGEVNLISRHLTKGP